MAPKEKAWESGYRAAMARVAATIYPHLDEGRDKAALLIERQGAIVALREVCAAFGDNEWDDSLDLSDIIEKHLHRPLLEKQRGRQ